MERKRRFLWHIFPTYLIITFLSLAAVTWYASGAFRRAYLRQTERDLIARAHLAAALVVQPLRSGAHGDVDRLCKELGARAGTRITVILYSGKVVGDSVEDPGSMDNHGSRAEIKAALSTGMGTSARKSTTTGKEMMYAAVLLRSGQGLDGILRTSAAVTDIEEALDTLRGQILMTGLIIALFAAAISLYVSRRLSRPLEEMRRGAESFAKGELERRLSVAGPLEMDAVADALNHMAEQLSERLETVRRQRNELRAVLSAMTEGVLAVDMEERVISMNEAAARMLECDNRPIQGRHIQELVRNVELQGFIATALLSEDMTESDIRFHDPADTRFFHAQGTLLKSAEGTGTGAVVVLNDMTRVRRLEKVRRDFVANVSHELKTPITAVKGFVETLLDGALENAEDARRFVGIIARHVDRLGAIVDDLLSLSRIEQDRERGAVELVQMPLQGLLEGAVQTCRENARVRQVRIRSVAPPDLAARIQPVLLEQALVNLIDNAVNHSDPGAEVLVEAAAEDGVVVIRVRDHGYGIAKKHLERIFERFYRVDDARSREQGGTGLGLAIVKHIVQAHGGHVTVESSLGKGSTFTIHLPCL